MSKPKDKKPKDEYQEPSRAEADLDTEHCLGIKPKLSPKAGIRAMRDRIAYIETEIARIQLIPDLDQRPDQLNRITELRADLEEAEIRLEEYETQHDARN